MIPDKCKNWKVANTPLLNYWCKCICGNTKGKLCEPWCRMVEKYSLWTLLITIGLPLSLIFLFAVLSIIASFGSPISAMWTI